VPSHACCWHVAALGDLQHVRPCDLWPPSMSRGDGSLRAAVFGKQSRILIVIWGCLAGKWVRPLTEEQRERYAEALAPGPPKEVTTLHPAYSPTM
jgi:hypothetical protein